MANLIEARLTLEQEKQKQQLAEEQAAKAEAEISESIKQSASNQAIAQTNSLAGRRLRQQNQQQIQSAQQQVEEYKQQISQRAEAIKEYESQVSEAESQAQDYQNKAAAVSAVRQIAIDSRDRKGVGTYSATYARRAQEAFEKAGLSGSEGTELYRDLVGGDVQVALNLSGANEVKENYLKGKIDKFKAENPNVVIKNIDVAKMSYSYEKPQQYEQLHLPSSQEIFKASITPKGENLNNEEVSSGDGSNAGYGGYSNELGVRNGLSIRNDKEQSVRNSPLFIADLFRSSFRQGEKASDEASKEASVSPALSFFDEVKARANANVQKRGATLANVGFDYATSIIMTSNSRLQRFVGTKSESLPQGNAQALAVPLGVVSSGASFVETAASLPYKKADEVKNFNIFAAGEQFGNQLRNQPGLSTGQIVGEVLIQKGLGRVATADKASELSALRKSADMPEIRFVGVIEEDTSKFVAKTTIAGEPVTIVEKLKTVELQNPARFSAQEGKSITFAGDKRGVRTITLRRTGSINEPLGASNQVRVIGDDSLKVIMKNPIEAQATLSKGMSLPQKAVKVDASKLGLIDTIGEKPIDVIRKAERTAVEVDTIKLERGTALSIAKQVPSRSDVFIVAGTTKPAMRIYKGGRITYVMRNPNIKGFVKFSPVKNSESVGFTQVQKQQIIQNAPVGSMTAAVKETAKQIATPKIKALESSILKERAITSSASRLLTKGKYSASSNQPTVVQTSEVSKTESITSPVLATREQEVSREAVKTRVKLETSELSKEKILEKSINVNTQSTNTLERSAVRQLNFQALKPLLKPRMKQDDSLKPTQTNTNITYKKARANFSKLLSSMKKAKGSELTPTEVRTAYNVFTRRKGKEIKVAENLPIGLATKAGVEENLKNLSRSFRLEEAGTTSKQDINYKAPERLFRPSKVDSKRTVQKAQFSLSSATEKSEINLFKKNKRGKKSKNDFLFG